MPKRVDFATEIVGRGVTGQTVTLDHFKPKKGERITYTNIAFENENTATSDLELVIRLPERTVGIDRFENLAAGDIVPYTGNSFSVVYPAFLRVDWLATVDNDVLHIYLVGYTEYEIDDQQ